MSLSPALLPEFDLEMAGVACLRARVMSHTIHHRAQLGVYLRLLDVPVPGLYGPSADDRKGGGRP